MSKTATIEKDVLTESISNTWTAYYYALAQQLDGCCDRNNWCLSCPARSKCIALWNKISDTRRGLNAREFKNYSKQIADLRDDKTKQLRFSIISSP